MLTGTNSGRIRGFHPLWRAFPGPCAGNGFVTPQCFRNPGTNPGLGYVRFRSPLLTQSMSFSFPSGTFHSASSSAFHRSIALLVHYRSSRSIQPWAVVRPVSREVPRASRYSGEPMLTGTCSCRIPDYHCLWCDFPDTSARNGFVTPHGFRNPGTNPGLGYFRFRSPLLTESMSLYIL
jgi:hypothetical protein